MRRLREPSLQPRALLRGLRGVPRVRLLACATRRAPASRSPPSYLCHRRAGARVIVSEFAGRAPRAVVAQVELAPLSFAWRSARKRATSARRRHGRRLLQHHQPAVERVRERVVRALALEPDARSAAFSAICASRAATSTCRVSRVQRGCAERVRGARWTVADPAVGDAGSAPVARFSAGAKRNSRGGTPVVRPLALARAPVGPGVEALRAGKLSLPIRGRTMVGGRARRGE